jgi:hypothetical protein
LWSYTNQHGASCDIISNDTIRIPEVQLNCMHAKCASTVALSTTMFVVMPRVSIDNLKNGLETQAKYGDTGDATSVIWPDTLYFGTLYSLQK